MAAGNTYVALATNTLTSSAFTVTFTSISGIYTDLVLVCQSKLVSGTNDLGIQFNSDTASNYSRTALSGDGTTASSTRASSATRLVADLNAYVRSTASIFNTSISHIQNYSNTDTYKTVLTRSGAGNDGIDAIVTLWRSYSAITSIDIFPNGGSANLDVGSSYTLYGIAAA